MSYMSLKNQRRIMFMLIFFVLCSCFLVYRFITIQVIKSEHYTSLAYEQQTRERSVEAKRGTIYDATGEKILAQSISVNIITATPNTIDKEKKEEIATRLAEILESDKENILSKLTKNTSSVTIASKVDEEKAKKVLEYVTKEDIAGIRIDEDVTRVYPYSTLLAQTLGFVGTDNQGLLGVEQYYDDELSGVDGKIVGSTDGRGRETPFTNEQYVEATDGKDIVLTIDATIQGVTEKYLQKAVEENGCEYGTAVVMNPKTGAVYAIATSPTFDLNEPFTPNTDKLKKEWDSYSSTQKSSALYAMWRNKCISDTAEPGSTFKIVTATAALEENVTTMDKANDFVCTGAQKVDTWSIKCWRYYNPHGRESLRQGIMNSCNPVFMQVAARMGATKYEKYLKAFNLYSNTGIDLPLEAKGIMHDEGKMSSVDLATTAFGQTIQITTLQTAVNYCAVANGGYLVTPYVVKEIKSSDGSYDKKTESKVLKQIMSKSTADDILSALESTVNEGTAKGAKVNGYRVGGKTATGEQGRGANIKYLAGFAAVAPVNDPQIVVVFNLYDPVGESGHGGATLCAPAVGSILDESLRYLDIAPDYTLHENNIKELVVPKITGLTVKEAKEVLGKQGFLLSSDVTLKDTDIIKDQIPKEGASLMEKSKIMAYISDDKKQTTSVPDVRNLSQDKAIAAIQKANLNVRVVGSGYVLSQEPASQTVLDKGSIVTIKCVDTTELP